jgi:hypothetical protein
MDIVAIRQAIDVIAPLLTKGQMTSLEVYIGEGLAKYHQDKSDSNLNADLNTLGIKLLDDSMIDESLYMDESPF